MSKEWVVTVTELLVRIVTREEAAAQPPSRQQVFETNTAWEAVLAAGRAGMLPEGEHKIEVRERIDWGGFF